MESLIKENLGELLGALNVPYKEIKINQENEKAYYTQIETDQSSLLIGWHGETINALQHILKCLLWNKGMTSETQLIVDVDGYKRRQEESVMRLAERKAEYAIENQKEIVLPSMNAYFRRKIHLHLAESDRFKDTVTTESVGSGMDRAVKIIPR